MHYHEAADFLFGLRRFAVSPGTESVEALLKHLDDPHEEIPFVQIAGSNGKGSTAKMVESICREAGLETGLYTSPHLDSLSERIRVDGRQITDRAVVEFVSEVRPWLVDRAAAGNPLTFFEVVTAMAIHEFARRNVDIAVLEVGLGGEYDATSAVDPIATAVTNVALEHTAVLGDTIEEVARTISQIATDGAPLVTAAEGKALDTVRDVASTVTLVGEGGDVNATYRGRITHADSRVRLATSEREFDVRLPLVGSHQAANAGVAFAVAEHAVTERPDGEALDRLSPTTVKQGLARADWPGRFEVMRDDPLMIFDGAHNPAACDTLAKTLVDYEYDQLHLVLGAMHDKNIDQMVERVPTPDTAITCAPALDRAADPAVLARALQNAGIQQVQTSASVEEALRQARATARPDDCILLTGSLYAVAEARSTFTRTAIPKQFETAADAEDALVEAHATGTEATTARDRLVHRVLKLQTERRQATVLQNEFGRIGGECVISAIDREAELVDVVLAGTLRQFQTLQSRLQGESEGLAGLSEEITTSLEDPSAAARGYPWEDGTAVMGVLNVTPDSFHDGGVHEALDDAVAGVQRMVAAGVDIIDVGGESTRPGADPVPVSEEIDRVVPVVEAVSDVSGVGDGPVMISVDTRKPEVAEAALDAGADIINDVTGLTDPRMRQLIADRDVPTVIMHSIDAPVVPDRDVEYDDVVEDIIRELSEQVLSAEKAGISRENVIVDPGIGFGKDATESFELLGRLDEFDALGCPIMLGHSHKSLFGALGREDGDRLSSTVAATALAADRGANIVRVHDVDENVAAIDVVSAASSEFED